MDAKIVQLLAAALGLLGGVILAFSLNTVLSEVQLAIDALAFSVETLAERRDVHVFGGLDKRLQAAGGVANSWVRAGLYCLTASTILAAYGIYLS